MAPEFQTALALHQRGQLEAAQALYEKILQKQPKHFDALHLLGAVAAQKGDPQRALDLFNQAIAINAGYAEAHFNRGVVQQQLGQLEPALASYDRAITLKPDHADAWFNRGNLLKDLRQFEAALSSYDRAVAIKPRFPAALFNRGNVQRELQRSDAALASYDQAIAIDAGFAEAYYQRACLQRALGRWETALASFDAALALKPTHADAWFNRGNLLKDLNQLEAALASYDQAIATKSGYIEAICNRGNVFLLLKRIDAALASYDQAIATDPAYAETYSNRGALFAALNRMDEALADYDRAIALKGDYAEVHSNRGILLQQLHRLDAALASHDRAIAIKPDSPVALFNRSLTLLMSGDFANGWAAYEWRWKNPFCSSFKEKREFSQPLWLGEESILGRTILLYGEQGFGDIIQFCRYAKRVADLGARVVLEVRKPLVGLLHSLEGVTELVTKGSALPDFDVQCPLMSLPRAFRTTLDTIPQPGKYLRADPAKIAHWEARLGEKIHPRIGLTWSGSPLQINDHNRSAPLADWVPHLPPGFHYVSLQKDVRIADQATLDRNPHIYNPASELTDFSDAAALCECMDLVISVCTSVAHLAGALDKKTWVLLSFAADWRWLLDRDDSPWYPTAKLYRQEKIADWNGVFARVEADLIREWQAPGDRRPG